MHDADRVRMAICSCAGAAPSILAHTALCFRAPAYPRCTLQPCIEPHGTVARFYVFINVCAGLEMCSSHLHNLPSILFGVVSCLSLKQAPYMGMPAVNLGSNL